MGQIIGEGITFDDVLLVPGYSQQNSQSGGSFHLFDKKDQIKYSHDERGNGYCYGAPYGYCHGKAGRYRNHPQKYVH